MKFSLVIFSSLLLLQSCAHRRGLAESGAAAGENVESGQLSLEELEEAEFADSTDPAVKMALARKLWCLEFPGRAYEHWLWVHQFAQGSAHAERAEQYLKKAQKTDKTLTEDLSCSLFQDHKLKN